MIKKMVKNLLYKDLSYEIHGAAIEVRKDFGPGHKEQLYQKAFEEELKRRKINYEREKPIKIFSPKDGKLVGSYRPDFIIDNKILVEIKAEKFVSRNEIKRIYDYLRNSKYELAYFINFASPKLFVKRIIYTNDRKPFLKKILVSLSLILVLFSGLSARAATIYFEPSTAEYQKGQTFILESRINLDPGENINVVEVNFKFPQDFLEIIDLSFGNSILTVIPHKPIINQEQGIVSFAGGIIGGYKGQLPGDPGLSNLLARIIFKVKENISLPQSLKINFLENSQVLLNDGFGTPTKLTFKPATINILESQSSILENKWQLELEKDKIPPEEFKIEIIRDPSIFEGKYFIVFSTTDKQTGIDHYEIQESRSQKIESNNWIRGESPYLLKDQKLKSYIYVKAIDKAGNERVEMIPPKNQTNWLKTIILLTISLIIFFVLFLFVKKIFITKKPKNQS